MRNIEKSFSNIFMLKICSSIYTRSKTTVNNFWIRIRLKVSDKIWDKFMSNINVRRRSTALSGMWVYIGFDINADITRTTSTSLYTKQCIITQIKNQV